MKAPQLLPPRDLLEQVQGVESGLRRGRSARVGGVMLGALQVVILAANSDWVKALLEFQWQTVLDSWQLLIVLFLLAFCVLAVGWARFWVRESEQPFRYTYSIAPFEPVTGEPERPLFVPLHADLRERLSQRIRRLSLLEEQGAPAGVETPVEGVEAAQPESHVHIFGYYALRKRPPEERWLAEITAWVRVGGPERPSRLAEPVVRFALPLADKPAAKTSDDADEPPELARQEYEWILERTYFSVATEVYRQIRADVRRKIELLPNRWFRASALFHEAYDYAHSNTLDAYEQAGELYKAALYVYDPETEVLPPSGVRRLFARQRRRLRVAMSGFRRYASRWFPRMGRAEVLAARAQIGYANTLLDTWILAPLSGLQAAATYEAVPIAKRAGDRLGQLAEDVRGYRKSRFDARVTLAFAHASLGARKDAREQLNRAAAEEPLEIDREARYLFVRALLEEPLHECVTLYQRAVDLHPRFEAAQFQLAATLELLWRTRQELERNVAATITEQYDMVLKLNPGNIAAWAKTGYMLWLLDEGDNARRRFEGGRRFKEIKQEAYVAEIDHGLARIAAEEGRFEEADRHYVQAVSARLAHGWAVESFSTYYFDRISPAILGRFRTYVERVREHYDAPSEAEQEATTERVRDSVLAFVLYDFSEACFGYWRRTHDYAVLEEAYRACTEATELNDGLVLALYLRYQLEADRKEVVPIEPDGNLLQRVEKLVPAWPEAAHTLLRWHDEEARRLADEADTADLEARKLRGEAEQLEGRLSAAVAQPTFGGPARLEASLDEPARLRADAARKEQDAEQHRSDVVQHEQRARKLVQSLLPHDWLWAGENKFNWAAITSEAADRELRWERSLEPFHVKILVAWCRSVAEKGDDDPRLDELLDLIERRFLPNDMDLVKFRCARANGGAGGEEYRRRMDQIARGWLAADESTFVALRRLGARDWEDCRVFAEVAALPELSPYLYHWLGTQLVTYWQRTGDDRAKDAAVLAFGRAEGVTHPDTLVDLADRLVELGVEGAAGRQEVLYRAAAEQPGASLEVLARLRDYFADVGDPERELVVIDRAGGIGVAAEAAAPENYAADKARVLLRLGRFADARAELKNVPSDGGELGASWRTGLAEVAGADAAAFRDWLGAEHRAAIERRDDAAAQDAGTAALEVARSARPGLWPKTDDGVVALPAIVVECHPERVPQGKETPFVQALIDEVPGRWSRILEDTGVSIPGLWLRTDPRLDPDGYVVLIHDVPVVQGTVPAGDLEVSQTIAESVTAAVTSRLANFVNLQSADLVLAEHQDRAGAILGDERRRCAFVSLLKRLVDDGVPIVDIPLLLDTCKDSRLRPDELERLAGTIRTALQDRLPGRDATPIRVPRDLEAQISEFASTTERRPESAIPFDRLTEFRASLTAMWRDAGGGVFVVSSPAVRPILRRIVALDLPGAPVLAHGELPEAAAEPEVLVERPVPPSRLSRLVRRR